MIVTRKSLAISLAIVFIISLFNIMGLYILKKETTFLADENKKQGQDITRLLSVVKYFSQNKNTIYDLQYIDFSKLLFSHGMNEDEVKKILEELDPDYSSARYHGSGTNGPLFKAPSLSETFYYDIKNDRPFDGCSLWFDFWCDIKALYNYSIRLEKKNENCKLGYIQAFISYFGVPDIYEKEGTIRLIWSNNEQLLFNNSEYETISMEISDVGANLYSIKIDFFLKRLYVAP
jgi:hypothetical protein